MFSRDIFSCGLSDPAAFGLRACSHGLGTCIYQASCLVPAAVVGCQQQAAVTWDRSPELRVHVHHLLVESFRQTIKKRSRPGGTVKSFRDNTEHDLRAYFSALLQAVPYQSSYRFIFSLSLSLLAPTSRACTWCVVGLLFSLAAGILRHGESGKLPRTLVCWWVV